MKRFCSAPWIDGVLHNNGTMFICCRNQTNFGNWKEEDLKSIWHNHKLTDFRKIMAEGKFPDKYCERCYNNGTARSLRLELEPVFTDLFSSLKKAFDYSPLEGISGIQCLFDFERSDDIAERKFETYFQTIGRLSLLKEGDKNILVILEKLKKLGLVLKAYLDADLVPSVIAPFRQVNIVSRCNAKCIHCSISNILTGPAMDKESIEKAFSHRMDIIDFFLYGSEFFLYKEWKGIAHLLVDSGVKLSVSTNGILFIPENIRYLIDNELIKDINVSIDGASKEMVESIRVNVNFDRLVENIKYLFYYAEEKQFEFNLTFSFVLMKRNYKELPELVRLLNSLRGNKNVPFSINCQALENLDYEDYINFVHKEHHSLVEREKLVDVFSRVYKESKDFGIPVTVFYSTPIEDFVNRGFPFPSLAV